MSTVTKWVGLVAGIWVQSLAGNANVFPNFAPALKSQLRISQIQLNNLGVAKDFGENVGLLSGTLSNLLPPWVILLIGALEGLFGYGTVWLVMSGRIAQLAFWKMCLLLMIGANSATCFNTAILVTCMRNFPDYRGPVVGIVKGFIGLSSAIYTQIYVSLLGNNASELVLFLAVGPFVVCMLVMYFIQPVTTPPTEKNSRDHGRGFAFIQIICIGLALYLFGVTLVETFVVQIPPLVYQIMIAGMLIFLCAPLAVPAKLFYSEYMLRLKEEASNTVKKTSAPMLNVRIDDDLRMPLLKPELTGEQDSNSKAISYVDEKLTVDAQATKLESKNLTESADMDSEKLKLGSKNLMDNSKKDLENTKTTDASMLKARRIPSYETNKLEKEKTFGCISIPRSEDGEIDPGTLLAVGEGAVRRRKGPRRGEDFTLRQAIVKADFWLLFLTFFCGLGTVLTAVNNLGQMGEAQGYSEVTIFVSLVSIMNFLSRLGGGALSEHYVRSSALPRTVWMMGAQVLMIIGHLLFASAIPGSLYIGSILLGTCHGVHVAIMVPTASELFGLRHFGMIYTFIYGANPIGSLLFSGMLAGYLYDKESAKDISIDGVDQQILNRYLQNSVTSDSVDVATCLGAHCFQLTFLIMALVCAVGVVLNIVLTLRIRRVYQSLYGLNSRNVSYQNLASAEGRPSVGSSTQISPQAVQKNIAEEASK